MSIVVDTSFDVYSGTPAGKAPDSHSPTLQSYHQLLWSKPLPNGTDFKRFREVPGAYLHHFSNLGDFALSSDAIGATYRHVTAMAPIIE